MAGKKKSKARSTPKKPQQISGLEASLLSLRARSSAIPAKFDDLKVHVSEPVRKIVFESPTGGSAFKTFREIRKVADANRREVDFISRAPRIKTSGFLGD